MKNLRGISDAELIEVHKRTHGVAEKIVEKFGDESLLYADSRAGGTHMHTLVRDENRTTEGGSHSHLFILEDGRHVFTERDGFHAHGIPEEGGDDSDEGGDHTHKIFINGEEFETSVSTPHGHELEMRHSTWSGIHTCELKIGGVTYESLTPGSLWEAQGSPTQATNPDFSETEKSVGEVDLDEEDPAEVLKAHQAVVVEMARRGMETEHESLIEAEGQNDEGGEEATLFVEFQKKDTKEHVVTGVVLQPEETDAQYDIYDASVIKSAQMQFTADLMRGTTQLGYMHTDFNKRFEMTESYIAPTDFTLNRRKVKKGSWIMSVKVMDKEVWKKIEEGEIRGFSIKGLARVVQLDDDETAAAA